MALWHFKSLKFRHKFLFFYAATMEYEAELRHKNDMKKLEAKMRAQYVTHQFFVIQNI